MKYLFGLQHFLKNGEVPPGIEFGPAVRRGLKQLREQSFQANSDLVIELQEQPEEIVQELIQGKKSVSYGGNMYVGYRKDFMFRETDYQFGVVAFVIDPGGRVIGLGLPGEFGSFGESLTSLKPKVGCGKTALMLSGAVLIGCGILYVVERF